MTGGSFWLRAATVIIALPLFFVLIFVLPHYNHLALSIGAVLAAALGSREVDILLKRKGIPRFPFVYLFAAVIPALTWLEVMGILTLQWNLAALTGFVVLILLRTLWVRSPQDLSELLQQVSSSLLVLLYPAVFLSFLVRLTGLKNPTLVLLFFFSIIFANDIAAYLFGMLLGRSTRLGYAVSPNKSAIGFAAGVLAAVGLALAFRALFPVLLPVSYPAAGLFGAALGVLTIAGDLVESALKRAAEVKDSGELIPGRGGILDSVDSWLLTAPFYYFIVKAMHG